MATIADVLRKYQNELSDAEYARRIGVTGAALSQVYSGVRSGRLLAGRFMRAFPEGRADMAEALAATHGEAAEPAPALSVAQP